MRAVVYKKPYEVSVEEVPGPRIEAPTDAVVRLTSTGLCGTDLHVYDGRMVLQPGRTLGHEGLGVVEEVGSAVSSIAIGNRVSVPFHVGCGFCFNCQRGFPQACLTTNQWDAGSTYGLAKGNYGGAQAEYMRVPYADFNLLQLPGEPGDKWEDDFVLLADIFPTGHHATVLADVRPGDSVAVFGAGPVGLLAAHSARLKGAGEVFVVDYIPERLKKAEEISAIPIDFSQGNPVEQILEMRAKREPMSYRTAGGERKMPGVMCGIDAVGYQSRAFDQPDTERLGEVLEALIELVNPTGKIGVIGAYTWIDPGAPSEEAKQGKLMLSLGKAWAKSISIGMGVDPVSRYNVQLRDLITSGRARPGFIVSHHMPLSEAPRAYREFDKRENGYTKIIFQPEAKAA
jgi:glutathione-independent formaldehyde dehydrogenase